MGSEDGMDIYSGVAGEHGGSGAEEKLGLTYMFAFRIACGQ